MGRGRRRLLGLSCIAWSDPSSDVGEGRAIITESVGVGNMTWQGGKLSREAMAQSSPFATLKPLVGEGDDAAKGLRELGQALGGYPSPLRLAVRLVSGGGDSGVDEVVEHWEVQAGSKTAKTRQKESKDADVVVVMRPETWLQIAQGKLAPYEALYTGRLRVGGDFEAAKTLTRHLSDPASPYVPPC